MIVRYDHLHLRSRDAAAAARFYVETFGAVEVARVGEAPAVTRVVLDLGGSPVFIEQAPAGTTPAGTPPHLGIEHLGLRVDDIEAAIAGLRERGVRVVSDIAAPRPGLRIAFVEGPDGVSIELLERASA